MSFKDNLKKNKKGGYSLRSKVDKKEEGVVSQQQSGNYLILHLNNWCFLLLVSIIRLV